LHDCRALLTGHRCQYAKALCIRQSGTLLHKLLQLGKALHHGCTVAEARCCLQAHSVVQHLQSGVLLRIQRRHVLHKPRLELGTQHQLLSTARCTWSVTLCQCRVGVGLLGTCTFKVYKLDVPAPPVWAFSVQIQQRLL
jgi:hypothetical protein